VWNTSSKQLGQQSTDHI